MTASPSHFKKGKEKGFALVIAVVVAAVLVSVTFVMFSITLKQVTLATAGKGSQLAFYAADTGLECALYADNKMEMSMTDKAFVKVVTATDASYNTHIDITAPSSIPDFRCNNQKITYTSTSPQGGVVINNVTYNEAVVSRFQVVPIQNVITDPSDPNYDFALEKALKYCAEVTVTKYVKPIVTGSITTDTLATKIESRGYNTCTNLTDPQRVERGLEVYY